MRRPRYRRESVMTPVLRPSGGSNSQQYHNPYANTNQFPVQGQGMQYAQPTQAPPQAGFMAPQHAGGQTAPMGPLMAPLTAHGGPQHVHYVPSQQAGGQPMGQSTSSMGQNQYGQAPSQANNWNGAGPNQF